MTITFIDLYNDITGQAWSMFDGEVEDKEEFETTVTTSIQKALSMLWNTYQFPFRNKTKKFNTKNGKVEYATPNGNIVTKTVDGKTVFAINCNRKYLEFVDDVEVLEEKTGEPKQFSIKNDKIYLYPTPDNTYSVSVDYLDMFCAIDGEEGTAKANLKEDEDYLNIPEKYEDVFRNTILPLAMTYLIASETDENYSAYWKQYQLALDVLLECTLGINKDKTIGWR